MSPVLQNIKIYWTGPLALVHTSVISSGELAAASYLRLGKHRCIDLIHTCLRPRCDDVRSRGHRKSLRLRSGTVTQMRVLITFPAVEWYARPVFRTHVNECGTVTCVTAASSTEEMTDVWTWPNSAFLHNTTRWGLWEEGCICTHRIGAGCAQSQVHNSEGKTEVCGVIQTLIDRPTRNNVVYYNDDDEANYSKESRIQTTLIYANDDCHVRLQVMLHFLIPSSDVIR
jgi:hypothetical protein